MLSPKGFEFDCDYECDYAQAGVKLDLDKEGIRLVTVVSDD